MHRLSLRILAPVCLLVTATLRAGEPTAAERGEKALLGRAFTPATITFGTYENAWKLWDSKLKEPPADYHTAFRDRYGLHAAPYPNNGYPMGLREGVGLLSKGLSTDCMLCHGGSIMGKSYVGLGNATIDIQAFFEELSAPGRRVQTPFVFGRVRGTSEAAAFAVFLLGFREPDLQIRPQRLDLDLHDDLCEDAPAWWLLKKKKTMYYTGGGDARSVRSLMQFMMSPLNLAPTFDREETAFRDIQAYLLSLTPPKYPLAIDRTLAAKGEQIFSEHCAKCHGTYGQKWTYPNRIVPLDVIGTDRTRFDGLSTRFGEYYNKSWFAQEKKGWFANCYPTRQTDGYQAPPLDGIWATAPYLHNGSVPTLYHLLNSPTRPRVFTRSYRTDQEAYDAEKVGWKITVLDRGAELRLPPYERRKIYDTTERGRGNGGHTFGDKLSEEDRMAVIEYLKTL
jgi:mono/diheme cytochrome c family protein